MSTSANAIFIVAGVGNGSGTGGSAARLFLRSGYHVAIIGRDAERLSKFTSDIKATGDNVDVFPIDTYDYAGFQSVFASIRAQWPGVPIRAALFNVGFGVWKPFLETTEAEVRETLESNVLAGAGFARQAITAFKENDLDASGKRGTLIFTGATASTRGNVLTSAFSAGKHGVRALSQSLAKEFGKQNIHVAHAIIDGIIITDRHRERRNDKEWEQNDDVRLSPDSIAKSYLALVNQDRSALTWELDLRPAHEKW